MLSTSPSCPTRCCRPSSAVPHTMLSENVPQRVVAGIECPRRCCRSRRRRSRCPTRCCRRRQRAPDDVVARRSIVPQTMLSPSPSRTVPHTMLSRSQVRGAPHDVVALVLAQRAPDDVVAFAVASRAPHGSELEGAAVRLDHAAGELGCPRGSACSTRVGIAACRPARREEPREVHRALGVEEAGALGQRVVARSTPAPCTG